MNRNADKSLSSTPPPIYYIVAFLIGIFLNHFFALAFIPKSIAQVAGLSLIVISFAIIPFVLIQYKKNKTPFDVRKKAKTLIIDGPNKFSRNPGYLSLTILYIGSGLAFNNFWAVILTVLLVIIINKLVIQVEEKQLEKEFGDDYLNYKKSVRRWI